MRGKIFRFNLLIIIFFLLINSLLFNQYFSIFATDNFEIDAKNSITIDVKTGRILHEKNAFERVSIASTTKIMTAIVALENANYDDVFEVSNKAAWVGGSSMGLRKGEKIPLYQLLYGLMLRSGNDAAVVIAEGIAGSVDDFTVLMNKKAKSLGLGDSNFVTPHGLDAQGQYSTAFDLAVLTKYALENKTFRRIFGTKDIVFFNRAMRSTNPLLGVYEWVDGGKTGYTSQAGRCLVLSANRNGFRIISVFLNCSTSNTRIQSAKKVLDHIFFNYRLVTLASKDEIVKRVEVKKGERRFVDAVFEKSLSYPLSKEEFKNIEVKKMLEDYLIAPVKKGDSLGKVSFTLGDGEVLELDVIAGASVYRKSVFVFFKENLNVLIRGVFSK